MTTRQRILLVDEVSPMGSTEHQAAFDLARMWNAELHVMMTGPVSDSRLAAIRDLEVLCAANDIIMVRHPHATSSSGPPLLAAALRADLVVVARGIRHEDQSAGRDVRDAAAAPILVVRDGGWPPTRIVVGDDGSIESHAAMLLAADIGCAFEAYAVVVDAIPEASVPRRDEAYAAISRRTADSEAEARVAADSDEMRERLGHATTGLLSHRPPAAAIEESASDAARAGAVLVAVGDSGKSEFDRHFGWSVSARAADIDFASILIVPRAWALNAQARRLHPG